MSRRELLVLSATRTSPGQRFRMDAWAPILRAAGIGITRYPFATPALERVASQPRRTPAKAIRAATALVRYPLRFPRLARFDAVLVYRAAVPAGVPLVESRLVSQRAPLALDIDDPIFLPPPRSLNPAARRAGESKWKRLCEGAHVTICHNEMVADYVRPYCRQVRLLPNVIDVAQYAPRSERAESRPRPVIGFNGSPTTVGELATIERPLKALQSEFPFDLHVLGGRSPLRNTRIPITEHPWDPDPTRELRLLHDLDVGVAPARDNEWNSFKSFVKVLVYMAVGLPVVASPVGSNPQVIRDGENGFLAATDEEWTEKLRSLITDHELRDRIGAAGRATIEEHYSLERLRPEIVSTFEELTGARAE